jgi:hypothetical protein
MRSLALAQLVVVAAACGDNTNARPDARTADAARADAATAMLCNARFTGNFAQTEAVPADCASLSGSAAGTALTFSIPASAIATSVAIAIELPTPPAIGPYSSESVATWSAMATQDIGNSHCFYVAGATSVPAGSFTLTLDAIDAAGATAHGAFALELAVLAEAETMCGTQDSESLQLAF